MPSDATAGWEFVAETDGSARLIGALARLDTDETYTRTDLSEAAGVSLKTLYLDGAVDECVSLGVLERVDTGEGSDGDESADGGGEGEPHYCVDPTSDVLRAAERFDAAVREVTGESGDPGPA